MWASGRYDLGLTEAEFWALTLKELNALNERYSNNQAWLNYRMGLICAVLANTVRDPKKKVRPFTAEDFMPKKGTRRQTDEQMFAAVQLLNAAFGGKVSEN